MLDLGKLRIGIEVDSQGAKQELKNFAGETDTAANKMTDAFSKVKTAMKAVVAAVVVKKIVGGIAKISKAALEAYAEFEQLEGGVKKIFGDDAAKTVADNAQKAFQTAGISANQYMEQVTSFSASLIQSLDGDTEKAAKTADMAIQDMADNANTFGTSMDAIQNAYQGFAKQNYTMLDNLKLGYGGTKEEMQRLLSDAEKLSGIHYDISSLDDVYQAIHVVQEEMNVTGTTAREAMSTIEGSVNAAKAAWQNFLAGLGDDNADMDTLVSNLVTSAGAALKNIVPRLGKILQSLIKTLINTAKNHANNGIDTIISTVVKKASELPAKLITLVGDALNSLADMLEGEGSSEMGEATANVISKIFTTVVKSLPNLIRGIIRLAVNLFQSGLETLAAMVVSIFNKIKNTVVKAWNSIKKKVAEKLNPLVNSAPIQTLKSYIDSAKTAWNNLKETLKHPLRAVVNWVSKGKSKATDTSVNGNYSQKRIGLSEVPYDNYKANLHKGEAVLTAAEANIWKRFINGGLKDTSEAKPAITKEIAPSYTYSFGNITVDVSSLKDLTTVEEFVDMMVRAKQFA